MSFATRKRPVNTLRARLTVWHLSILTVTLTVFATLCYGVLAQSLYRHHDDELARQASDLIRALRATALTDADIGRALAGTPIASRFVMIRDHRGELVYRDPALEAAEPTIGRHEALVHAATATARTPTFFTVALERSGDVRFVCVPMGPDAYVQVGDPLGDVRDTLRAVTRASLPLIPAMLLLSGIGGWMTTKRALTPLHTIAATLRNIQATDLSRRVEIHPTDAELTALVSTLNELLDRLQRSFDSLRQFAGDVSHQILTPLTVINGALDAARRAPAVASADRAWLDESSRQVDDIRAIVSDLQAFALADAPVTTAAAADLSDIVREAADIVAALAEPGHVTVRATIQPHVLVRGDAVRLKQVVLNLGDNAVKYTPPGGRVTLALEADTRRAVLRVTDTGIGIPDRDLPRLFDRLFRADAADRSARGAGLGLAIAKRIVDAHHGRIAVESTPGEGSTFTVTLPRSMPA